ncbi:MAG TPA: SDR family NAD(P)-dependent oxidoreductase, partial [Usitatibacter sp.]|nr:SDR family NAD(P)-dependent oxidoreductase [Usitatibacter sp.]
MDLKLEGKNAIVTGASAGIGRAIAKGLAAEGVRLVVSGRRANELESLAREIEKGGGAKPVIVVHDAMDPGYVDAIMKAAEAVGPIGILVNNAGGSRAFGKDA